MTRHIAIFASGEGTNTQHLINYFKEGNVKISLVLCNNAKAKVLDKASAHNIRTIVINRDSFYNSNDILHTLKKENIDWIICAGFLWKIPANIIKEYANRIVNIHPALLPKFGGKGMYGMHVHQAVIEAKEKKSGITIHYVNDNYDEGEVILQKECVVDSWDTPHTLAQKIHELEHLWFAKTIHETIIK